MTIDDDMLLAYALGNLTPEEEGALETHLRSHPEDAAEVQAHLESLALLTLALPPEPLAQGGEAALLARVRGLSAPSAVSSSQPFTDSFTDSFAETFTEPSSEPFSEAFTEPASELPPVFKAPPKRSRSGWWALMAAVLLGGIYLAVLAPPGNGVRVAEQLERYEREPGSSSFPLADEATGDPVGTLVRLQSGQLFVTLDRPPAEERVYQAWEIRNGTPISLGTFDERTLLTSATDPGSVFGLTVEPPGGSEQPTTTPFVLLEL